MRSWLAATVLLAAACESFDFPATGPLRVRATTTGSDIDLDGYAARVDGIPRGLIGVNGSLVIADLATGTHTVEITGVSPNCTVTGDNPREATVFGDSNDVTFPVVCAATGVRVSAVTTGPDLDANGYTASVDGAAPVAVGVNASVNITRLSPGAHAVTLDSLATNCAVTGDNPRSFTVTNAQVEPVAFAVTCSAVTGMVEVLASTSGLDLDTNGYTVRVDSGTVHSVSVNGTARFPGLSAGMHSVELIGLAPNCAVAGDNPRTVSVTTGGATRDTARTTYQVICAAFAGVIEVTTATTGVDGDQAYVVRLDSESSQPAGANGVVRFSVIAGAHEIALEDVAPNCEVAGENPRTLSVTAGGPTRDTVRTTYAVTCVSRTGTARIITATSGTDLDANGYFVSVDCYEYYGGCYSYLYSDQLAANDTVEINVSTGPHTFQIEDIAPNCTLSGDYSRSVHVAGGVTTDVVFSLACAALARIAVTTTTTGTDLDATGYGVVVSGPTAAAFAIGVNETKQTPALLGGDYTVSLGGLSLNCTATSPSEVSVTAAEGATVAVAFSVDCATAAELAFTTGDIYTAKANGAVLTQLTTHGAYDYAPAWSPDGSKVAFTSARDGNHELYVIDAAGTNETRLTTNTADDSWPAWSPDGSKIAFTSRRDGNNEIYVMDANGSNPVNLTMNAFADEQPAWSPDGTKIAFASARGGIYVMNANGSGVTQITHDVTDGRPTWSPDGTKLAFSRVASCGGYYSYYCQRDVFVVNGDGSGNATAVASSPADEGEPAWSPDGTWIAFSSGPCDYYYGCYDYGIRAVRNNGTDERMVVAPSAFHPAWKP